MIKLIVGLGNPGPEYDKTRHNAGAWFVEMICKQVSADLRPEKKFHGLHAKIRLNGNDCHLLLPTTFMNHSGQAVKAVSQFYKIAPQEILIAHDELDLPPGCVRLKREGGHAGHNGLRDIIHHLGSKDFLRLRLGIEHPGHAAQVSNYVLGRPSKQDAERIENAIEAAWCELNTIISGDIETAKLRLHTET